MKHLILWIFIFFTACSSSETKAIQNQKELIVKTTSSFYEHYIKNIGMDDDSYITKYLYTQKEIDHTFAQKIEGMEEVAKHDELRGYNIGYDPIILAQDIPLGLKYSVPIVSGKHATIKVLTHYGDSDYQATILVTLKKVDTTWKIVDISKPTL